MTKEKGLPIGPGAYIRGVSKNKLPHENWSRVYVKNSFATDILKATHVFVGDYKYDEICKYAKLSQDSETGQGIKRLAVVRLDVDDLGAAFMAGFSYQDSGKYNTLARSATFSRSMSLFFNVYINQLRRIRNYQSYMPVGMMYLQSVLGRILLSLLFVSDKTLSSGQMVN